VSRGRSTPRPVDNDDTTLSAAHAMCANHRIASGMTAEEKPKATTPESFHL
jgi:hypothetical protein